MIQEKTLREVILSQRKFMEVSDLGAPREVKAAIQESFTLVIIGVRRCGKSMGECDFLIRQRDKITHTIQSALI